MGGNWDPESQIDSKVVYVGLFTLERNVLGRSTPPMFSKARQEKEKLGDAAGLELKILEARQPCQ